MSIKNLRLESVDKGFVIRYCEEEKRGNPGSSFPEMSQCCKEEAFDKLPGAVKRFTELSGTKEESEKESDE